MEFSGTLLQWYDQHARSLPWRGSGDPYLIWVSEIIFQQTRIEQGIGYYHRFTERFPDLHALALASEDEVLKVWQGLGYYSRARNMLVAARCVEEEFMGSFPREFHQIRKLKGVGDYTASCIASIAFGKVHAAVDGNVYRVLSRFYADPMPIDSSAGRVHFKRLAEGLISHDRPGDFNEALMDLGAMICKPRNPLCSDCPLRLLCSALERGTQTSFPVKSPAAAKQVVVMNYILVRDKTHILIRKRAGKGIWQGLYELPMITGDMHVAELEARYLNGYGLKTNALTELNRTRHILSHQELDIRFYESATGDYGSSATNDLLAVESGHLADYPFPKPLADFLSGRG